MNNSCRAYWSNGDGTGLIVEGVLREPHSTEVIVRMLTSGISRGTEALVFKGLVPVVERQRMRCPHQEGEFPGPVKYGYCAVGLIEWGPSNLIGRRVFCLHPHQDRFIIPIASISILPDNVPTARAVLAANMETALNALWDLGPRVGDKLAIVGVGVIGALVAAIATRMPEVDVQLVDPNPERAKLAQIFGCNHVIPDHADCDADCVVHASGHADGLMTALSIAGFEATILELSWYGSKSIPVSLGEHFHSRRLTLRSSQVGSIATVQRSRWDYERRMQTVMRLLNDDRLDALLDGLSAFNEMPRTMAQLASGSEGTLCHRIIY
jgi:threonine dehydrogenase-like Zn-dependent dehydrogenase